MIAPVSRPAVFSALARAPKYRTPLLWVSHVDSSVSGNESDLGVAFAIGRHFGNAVERNRARRRLRAAFRSAVAQGSPARGAVLVRCDRSILVAPHSEIVGAATSCLQAAHKAATSRSSAHRAARRCRDSR